MKSLNIISIKRVFILEDDQKVHLAINRLGLNSLGPFILKETVTEYMLDNNMGPRNSKSVKEPTYSVGARTTVPGGGSVAANVGALGAALAAMVGKMSYGKKAFEQNDQIMRQLIPLFYSAINELFILIDATLMLISIM